MCSFAKNTYTSYSEPYFIEPFDISFLVDQELREEVTKLLDENKPILKSWLLSHLADKEMEDIRGATGQNQLRREIREHFNSLLYPGGENKINTILFREFNIQ